MRADGREVFLPRTFAGLSRVGCCRLLDVEIVTWY